MENLKYERAAKRVKELKNFYNHLKIFIAVHIFLFLLRDGVFNSFAPEGVELKSRYFDWVIGNVIVWGAIIVANALYVFRHNIPFLKDWEEKQIEKYMNKDKEEAEKYR